MGVSSEFERVATAAEKLASKLGDSYVTSEHLLCALADDKTEAGSILKAAGLTGKRVEERHMPSSVAMSVLPARIPNLSSKRSNQYGRNVTDLASPRQA